MDIIRIGYVWSCAKMSTGAARSAWARREAEVLLVFGRGSEGVAIRSMADHIGWPALMGDNSCSLVSLLGGARRATRWIARFRLWRSSVKRRPRAGVAVQTDSVVGRRRSALLPSATEAQDAAFFAHRPHRAIGATDGHQMARSRPDLDHPAAAVPVPDGSAVAHDLAATLGKWALTAGDRRAVYEQLEALEHVSEQEVLDVLVRLLGAAGLHRVLLCWRPGRPAVPLDRVSAIPGRHGERDRRPRQPSRVPGFEGGQELFCSGFFFAQIRGPIPVASHRMLPSDPARPSLSFVQDCLLGEQEGAEDLHQ